MIRIAVLLPLVLAAALLLRASSGPDLRDTDRVLDARTADHLRRIELALATGRTPVADHFLDVPRGAEIPEPALFDAVLAAAAELRLRTPDGPQETGGVEEEGLETLLARMPAILLLLAVFGVVGAVRAVRASEPGARSEWAACAAGLLVVLPSLAADPGGRVELENSFWLGALGSLLVWRSLALLAARDPLDVVLAGLVLGVLASLALASGPAAILFALLPTFVFLSVARRGPELAQGARRGGILFGIVLVVLGGLGRESLAPSAGGGLATSWIGLLPWIGACALAPHLAAWLVELWRSGNRWRALVCVAGFGFLAALTPRAFVALRALAGACLHARPFAAELAGDFERTLAWTSLAFALLAASLAFLVERKSRRTALAPALAALPAGVAACAFPLLAALAAPLGAIALGRALAHLSAGSSRSRASAVALGVLALLVSAALGWLPRAPLAPPEAIAGLRWMREGTPSAGPWNAPWTPKTWCALAPWSVGGLIAYHARRPPLSSTWEPWLEASDPSPALALVQEPSVEALVDRLRAQRVRYVLGGRWIEAEWRRSLEARPPEIRGAFESGALARMLQGDGAPRGLRAVWTSALEAGVPDPALVIYELAVADEAAPGPELRSR